MLVTRRCSPSFPPKHFTTGWKKIRQYAVPVEGIGRRYHKLRGSVTKPRRERTSCKNALNNSVNDAHNETARDAFKIQSCLVIRYHSLFPPFLVRVCSANRLCARCTLYRSSSVHGLPHCCAGVFSVLLVLGSPRQHGRQFPYICCKCGIIIIIIIIIVVVIIIIIIIIITIIVNIIIIIIIIIVLLLLLLLLLLLSLFLLLLLLLLLLLFSIFQCYSQHSCW